MVRLLILGVAFFLCSSVQAEEVSSRLMDFVPATQDGEVALAFLEEGRVLRLPLERTSREQLESLAAAANEGDLLQISYNDLGDADELVSLQRVSPNLFFANEEVMIDEPETSAESGQAVDPTEPLQPIAPPDSSEPTDAIEPIAQTPTRLFSYLVSMKLRKSAQCFERAYLWAHQMWKTFGLRSGKVFVFFSPDFIRKHRYRWWFHVAPSTSESHEALVLDATYTTAPRTVQGWLDDITPVRVNCSIISAFKGKASLPRSSDCVLRYTHMYVFGSNHLMRIDQRKQRVSGWMTWALQQSKRRASP